MKTTCALVVPLLCAGMASVGFAQEPGEGSVKERVKAVRKMADQGSAAIPGLARYFDDPENKVRQEAVKSIVRIGTQHSLDPLVRATGLPDPEVQVRATDGLVNFYLPGYVDSGWFGSFRKTGTAIKGYFTDINDAMIPPDMQVRPEVIAALGKLARGGASMEARANAARAVGILRGQAAVPDLLEAVRSKNSQVIYEALIALQKIRDRSAAAGVAFLLRDLDNKVQIAALETVGLLQYHDALPQLYEALLGARNKEVRRAALTAVAMLPDERSRPYYQQHIAGDDPLLRAAAAEGFARLRTRDDAPMLQTYFDSEKKMNPRLSLAFALVMLGRTDLGEFSPLRYLVNNLNTASYQGVAEPFLVELAREEAVRDSLYRALPDATKDEKLGLVRVLGRSGDAASLSHLERLASDADSDVAAEAARSLRALKTRLG